MRFFDSWDKARPWTGLTCIHPWALLTISSWCGSSHRSDIFIGRPWRRVPSRHCIHGCPLWLILVHKFPIWSRRIDQPCPNPSWHYTTKKCFKDCIFGFRVGLFLVWLKVYLDVALVPATLVCTDTKFTEFLAADEPFGHFRPYHLFAHGALQDTRHWR